MPTETASGSATFTKRTGHRIQILLLLVIILLFFALLSLWTGSYRLSLPEIISTLFAGNSDSLINHLIWNIRLPRTVAAILAGSTLALSGSIMQTMLKNPLAAPSTLGVSQGAAFGAAFAIIFLGAGQTFSSGNEAVIISSRATTAACAFGGGLLSVIGILAISSYRDISSESMVLAGVAMGAFLSACTMMLQYFASDVQVASTLFWTFGDLGKAGWQENRLIAMLLLPAFCYLLAQGWSLNALQWGDDIAHSLGVSSGKLRVIGLLLTCLLVSVTTAFLGIIAFIGLMAPHIIRPFVGTDQRFLIPASSLCGAVLLLAADCISRTILAPVVIPVGIITSFAGAPLFLYLLLRRRRL